MHKISVRFRGLSSVTSKCYQVLSFGMRYILLATLSSIATLTTAQYFPPTPEGVTKVKSKTHEGVYVSFKEVCPSSTRIRILSG
jgi:hypothetical protein